MVHMYSLLVFFLQYVLQINVDNKNLCDKRYHWPSLYNTIQYNTIQYNTIQYNTIKLYCPGLGN